MSSTTIGDPNHPTHAPDGEQQFLSPDQLMSCIQRIFDEKNPQPDTFPAAVRSHPLFAKIYEIVQRYSGSHRPAHPLSPLNWTEGLKTKSVQQASNFSRGVGDQVVRERLWTLVGSALACPSCSGAGVLVHTLEGSLHTEACPVCLGSGEAIVALKHSQAALHLMMKKIC